MLLMLWKITKIAGTAAAALAVLYLIGNAALIGYTGSRLEERLKAVRDAGDPVTLKDLARTDNLPPEKNAATYLRRARADLTALRKETYLIDDRLAEGDGKISEADRKALRKAFDAYPKLFPLLEQAAECPDYDGDLDYTAGVEAFLPVFLEQVQKHREAANALRLRARLLIAEGKCEEAMQDALTTVRLARHVEREPLMISYLVVCALRALGMHTANEALRAGPVSAKARAALDAELARADDAAAYVRALKTERVYGTEMYRTTLCGNWFTRAYLNDDQCYHLDLLARHIALAPKTYKECVPLFDEFRDEAKSWRHRVSSLISPAIAKVFEAHTRTRALVRCLRVFNALQQKVAPDDKTAPKLADLGLPAAATTDPYNGEPLHVRWVKGGWVVYAVGRDLTDNGGQVKDSLTDVGYGPAASH
jgi:hypothetical protein